MIRINSSPLLFSIINNKTSLQAFKGKKKWSKIKNMQTFWSQLLLGCNTQEKKMETLGMQNCKGEVAGGK